LEFIVDVVEVIVDKVMECGIGVCGLCVIIEEVFFNVMYDVFLCEDIGKVVVIGEVVFDNVNLILVFCEDEFKKKKFV